MSLSNLFKPKPKQTTIVTIPIDRYQHFEISYITNTDAQKAAAQYIAQNGQNTYQESKDLSTRDDNLLKLEKQLDLKRHDATGPDGEMIAAERWISKNSEHHSFWKDGHRATLLGVHSFEIFGDKVEAHSELGSFCGKVFEKYIEKDDPKRPRFAAHYLMLQNQLDLKKQRKIPAVGMTQSLVIG